MMIEYYQKGAAEAASLRKLKATYVKTLRQIYYAKKISYGLCWEV